jgi:hypothetical protein
LSASFSLSTNTELELLYDWRFTANQFVLATSPLRLTTSNFIFQLNTCCYGPYVTPSLPRGRVCRLQLLLVLASAVILRSESRRAHDHITLYQIRISPNLEGQVPVFISRRNRVARLYPRQWVPFSSPPTTRRVTVDLVIQPQRRPHRKRLFHYCVFSRYRGNVSTELLPSNGCCTIAYLHSCYLAMGLHVTV